MGKYDELLNECLTGSKYLTKTDLRLDRSYGYLLNKMEYNEFLDYKENSMDDRLIALPLISFNSKKIYYYSSNELNGYLADYNDFFNEIDNYNSILKNYDEISLSIVASELEGTLELEGVNTTRKQVMAILNDDYKVENNNDQIIKNMYNGLKYILARPLFNKENLLKLYNILSFNSLNESDKLKPQNYYRDDLVYVAKYEGAKPELINEAMDSLFDYINKELNNHNILLPFIAHYYILYIHPYFDFNGRTARMVAIWISILMDYYYKFPLFISEAINYDKHSYYKAIEESRDSRNDLTYFLSYLASLSNKYLLIYRNLDELEKMLNRAGEGLTVRELNYLKAIIINSNNPWFNYEGFKKFARLDITKQGALKILNHFLKLKILEARLNIRNEKIFKLNDKALRYALKY